MCAENLYRRGAEDAEAFSNFEQASALSAVIPHF
jgi:hypothetical protein